MQAYLLENGSQVRKGIMARGNFCLISLLLCLPFSADHPHNAKGDGLFPRRPGPYQTFNRIPSYVRQMTFVSAHESRLLYRRSVSSRAPMQLERGNSRPRSRRTLSRLQTHSAWFLVRYGLSSACTPQWLPADHPDGFRSPPRHSHQLWRGPAPWTAPRLETSPCVLRTTPSTRSCRLGGNSLHIRVLRRH